MLRRHHSSVAPQHFARINKSCPDSGPSCGSGTQTLSFPSTTDYTNCATGSYDIESGDNFKVPNDGKYTFTVAASNAQDDPNSIGFQIYADNTWPVSDDFIYQRGSYAANGSEVGGGVSLSKGQDYYIATPTNATGVFSVCFTQT